MTIDLPQDIEFKTMHTLQLVALDEHILTMLGQNPEVEVHLGCDSQNTGPHTIYVTALVFRFPNNGAHVVFKREKLPRINDMWTKLWGETERSVMYAHWIREKCRVKVKQIDLDFNSDPAYPSNRILGASEGYVRSLGFEPKEKPNLLMAAWAANVLCQ